MRRDQPCGGRAVLTRRFVPHPPTYSSLPKVLGFEAPREEINPAAIDQKRAEVSIPLSSLLSARVAKESPHRSGLCFSATTATTRRQQPNKRRSYHRHTTSHAIRHDDAHRSTHATFPLPLHSRATPTNTGHNMPTSHLNALLVSTAMASYLLGRAVATKQQHIGKFGGTVWPSSRLLPKNPFVF